MLFRTIREIKVSSDWFGCVLVISFYVAKVNLEWVTYVAKVNLEWVT